ncbi:MAG: hypothetical protein KGQ95_09345 [Acidobacteria bacterium]|nr:hypothetical protein [Acidobacteriota bacterium]
MVTEADIYKRARILRDIAGHAAGEECTIVEVIDGRMMLEFDDHDWGQVVPADALELVDAEGASAA